MGPRKKDPRIDQRANTEQEKRESVEQDEQYDDTVADSFPASDPPAASGITGTRREPDKKPSDAE
jgi:hypothetical protein